MAGPVQFEELTLEKLETFLLRFADERRTGQLKIQGEGARGGRLDLREGRIVAADSPFVSEGLGEIAKKLGYLSMADVQKAVDALSLAENAGKQLGDILVGEKLITSQALETCIRYQAESAIHSLIGFHGRISFLPGNVAPAEISLDPREVLRRMKERDHVEEMGSAFLGLVPGAEKPETSTPEYETQAEVRRIAQAVIREAAMAAEAMQKELEAQAAAGAAQELILDHSMPSDTVPGSVPPPAIDVQAADLRPLEAIVADTALPDDRPRLARVIHDICRPGASSTEVLLDYAIHFATRAVLFAATSKGMRVAGSKIRQGLDLSFPSKLEGLVLPKETEGGAISRVMDERVPARGPFEYTDAADTALVKAVGDPPDGDRIMFPIALHEKAIGLLYADGVPPGDPGLLEGLAAAVTVTAVVMENKLVMRTGGDLKKKGE